MDWPWRRLGRRTPRAPAALGRWGERFVRRRLCRDGWRFVARNVTCQGGELDLVLLDPEGVLVFLEVKTRRAEGFAPTESVVTYAKKQRLARAIRFFLARYDLGPRARRVDVVILIAGDGGPPRLRHYRGALDMGAAF